MYLDFHTHGKLAKYLPFSTEYTDWLLGEAKAAGLDAICLTEHFNTQQFDTLYGYIAARGEKAGDAFVFEEMGGLKVFPGMETDIAEGGHVLCAGPMEAIREMNRRLAPHKTRGTFLPAAELFALFDEYPVLVGAGHPFREGGHIPELPRELLDRLTAGLLKRALKEIHALGGDYVSVLLRSGGESPAVLAAKRAAV